MILRSLRSLAAFMPVALAAQPSAPSPVSAPLRELPWGQLNVLHTTDTHGWHAGHLQEPSFSADWGDYVSFAARMKEEADRKGVDVILVDTGDRVEGNGLYDGSKPKGNYTYDIFKQQEIDVICSGNHELYKKHTADNEYLKTAPNFKGNYLASNIDIIDPKTKERVPLGARYRKFTTKNQGIRVLAFGFLFDFTGNYNNTFVQKVAETIEEKWFQDAIRDKELDLILVTGHVGLRDDSTGDAYTSIYKTIRGVRWDMPIQFVGGHTHIRDYRTFDSKAYGIESGRYLETIGFASIDGLKTKKAEKSAASLRFDRRYIDNNLFSYHHHTGLNESTFPTDQGRNTSKLIREAREALDLDRLHGCAPQDFWVNRAPYPSDESMFTWLQEHVLPDVIVDEKRSEVPRLAIINTGAMRFDIFKGPFTKDTAYSVSPFTGGFRYFPDVPYSAASKVLDLLNNGSPVLEQGDPRLRSWMLAPPEQLSRTGVNAFAGVAPQVQDSHLGIKQQQPLGKPELTPGYTTKDDLGEDGDDTLHSEIKFYKVPNCVQAEIGFPAGEEKPESVDLVFMDFIQPWVILALLFAGQDCKAEDVMTYMDGESMTRLLVSWIEENWSKDC
ncbi:MAG: hypothetical protein M1824_003932 [Vezdaea acicularis]|nr:MAG: hypothetical protein M1824_003932 [Vezdaea acicularis]